MLPSTGVETILLTDIEGSARLWEVAPERMRPARFFGVAEALTALTGLHRDPADEAFVTPLIAKAREALGEARFGATEASGRALGYEEAIGMTRGWLASAD
jgi:hypothetical protein